MRPDGEERGGLRGSASYTALPCSEPPSNPPALGLGFDAWGHSRETRELAGAVGWPVRGFPLAPYLVSFPCFLLVSLQHPLVSSGNPGETPWNSSFWGGSEPCLRLFWGQNRQNTGYFAGMYVTSERTRDLFEIGADRVGELFGGRGGRGGRAWSGESRSGGQH